MTLDEFRAEITSYWHSADDFARSFKDPSIVLSRLLALYRKFNEAEKIMADQIFCEWVLSGNERLRFDALALIDELKISSALYALDRLTERMSLSVEPGAPYELKKIIRIKDGLHSGHTNPSG